MLKSRKNILIAALLYTAFIVYFMFFAFGRTDDAAQIHSYTFIFAPGNFFKLPDLSELLSPSLMDLVSLGNVAAFIPFGILVPLLRPIRFVSFLGGFILSILILETVQALTFLGSFDLGDVLTNALGASIGFGAYRLGMRAKTHWKKIVVMGASIALMLVGVWGIGSGIDKASTKNPGPFQVMDEWIDSSGKAAQGTGPSPFEIGGQTISPEFNVYDSGASQTETYRYKLDRKELHFTLQYGIPDSEDFEGSISVSVDGKEILSSSDQNQAHEPYSFEWHFEQADELTITLEGHQKAWDIGSREMEYFWE